MADKGPEHEDGNESLSATAMFLRSFPGAAPVPAVESEPRPTAPVVETARTDAGEFTRMFRTLDTKPAGAVPAPAVVPPVPPPPAAAGDFTRVFGVSQSGASQPPAAPSVSAKPKGFSTPGISDSASADGAFTRIFRPEPQPRSHERDLPSFPVNNSPAPAPEPLFGAELQPRETSLQSSSITEMFRALSSENEKEPLGSAHRPEPAPAVPRYTEPTRIPVPDRPASQVPVGGGVTQLLNMLTAETPLMPAPITPVVVAPPSVQQEVPAFTPPADTRGEFTRIIQRAEIKDALATPAPPPPQAVSPGGGIPLPKLTVAVAPMPLPVAQPAPAVLPKVPVPVLPKVQVAAPALAAPAVVAPAKSKLQEMVPLLLVANGFLMLILILLVALALHRK